MYVIQLWDRRGDWEADRDLGGPGSSEPIREGEGVGTETSLGLPDVAKKKMQSVQLKLNFRSQQ